MPTDADWLKAIDPIGEGSNEEIGRIGESDWLRHMTQGRGRRWSNGARPHGHIRGGLLAAAAVIAAAVIAAVWLGDAVSPSSASAVTFVSGGNGSIVVTIHAPNATASALASAFSQHHLDISVQIVPVSPSEVDQILTMEGPGSVSVHPIATPGCPIGDPTCPITLLIDNVTGHSSIVVGRAAEPGEQYASAANAFGPDEVLHCSGLLGFSVARAQSYAASRGLHVSFEIRSSNAPGTSTSTTSTTSAPFTGSAGSSQSLPAEATGPPSSTPGGPQWVVGGLATSASSVTLFTSSIPLTPSQVEATGEGSGC